MLNPGHLASSAERLVAFLMMSVLVGIIDNRETGCLHVQRQGGGPLGLIVFERGRVAWAPGA